MRSALFLPLLVLLAHSLCFAQIEDIPAAPEKGGNEVQVWAGGGHSVGGRETLFSNGPGQPAFDGGNHNTSVMNAGLRYGWILTGPHLPSLLRGRFEYALDAVPVFVAFQPASTAYGIGFDPLGLKWNFERRGRLSPYFELTGGVLFSNHNIPMGTNTVNFMDQAALGTHILGAKYNVSLEFRFMHISNAGLATPNPGLNTVQVRLGIGKFFRSR
jgi:hypothetical protein